MTNASVSTMRAAERGIGKPIELRRQFWHWAGPEQSGRAVHR
jgi:hypothetical protein